MDIQKILENKSDSSNKRICGNEWLSLYEKDGWYTYVHEEKSNGRGVAVLGFKKDKHGKYRFTAHMESHVTDLKTLRMASITGQMDHDTENEAETAIRELEEEAGIKAPVEELIELGTVDTYKASDTIHHLFGIDCENYDIGEAKGDGTAAEENEYSIWITEDELANCSDPLIHALYCRLENRGFLKEESNK